jgi:hypothetical protein
MSVRSSHSFAGSEAYSYRSQSSAPLNLFWKIDSEIAEGFSMSPAPSPRVRQVAGGFAVVFFGLGCLIYGREWRFVFISISTTEIVGLAIVLLGVFLSVLAFKEIPCTHRIDRLVTSGVHSKTRNPVYLSFMIIVLGIAMFSRRSLTALWIVESVLVFY